MRPARILRRNPFDRLWVVALLVGAACLFAVGMYSIKDWPYWGQPRVSVTVTEVVYRDGDHPGGQSRCPTMSKLAVESRDGRVGFLYECATFLSEGEAVVVQWHPDEARARTDVVSPLGIALIGGGIYTVAMLLVVVLHRRWRALEDVSPYESD